MATPNRSDRFRSRTRQSIAGFILVLLPLLALGGALMPGMVEIAEEEDTSAEIKVPEHKPLRAKRRPLLIPRDFSTGFVPELVNFDQLLHAPSGSSELLIENIASLSNFGAGQGDLIILDDIEEFVRNVLFKDVLDQGLGEDAPGGPFDESLFALIPNPIGADTGFQFDDFAGAPDSPQPVPEPSTALLMLLGLGALAGYGKRNQIR